MLTVTAYRSFSKSNRCVFWRYITYRMANKLNSICCYYSTLNHDMVEQIVSEPSKSN